MRTSYQPNVDAAEALGNRHDLHIANYGQGKGYIEDRRPCANVDPYVATQLIIETVMGDY